MPSHQYTHRSSREPNVHLNLNVRGMRPSATLGINERSAALIREGRRVFRLGLGQSPFPVPDAVVEQMRSHARERDYLPVKGLPALQEAVAQYHRRRNGIAARSEDVLVGPGSKELMFLLQLVYYGDLVVPTPAWVSYAPQAAILGRKIVWLPTDQADDWHVTPDELERFCRSDPDRPRILVLNYPNNPSGCTYRVESLRALAEVARRYRVVLLSDEIYGELHFRGQHVSVARFYPEGTIVSGGLSKWCGAGGWRLGTFLFPYSLDWLRDAMAAVASETYTSTCAPVQFAAVRAYEGGLAMERYLERARRILRRLGLWCWRRLTDAGIGAAEPKGAFYLFCDFGRFEEALKADGIETSTDLCARALDETGVAMLPGSEFGRPPEELTVRIAYVDFDGATAMSRLERLAPDVPLDDETVCSWAPNVVEAVDRLVRWLPSASPA